MNLKDTKIGAELWISGTNGRGYVKLKKDVPGLLWAELCELMDEWGKFKMGQSGTRFDRWLDKKEKAA